MPAKKYRIKLSHEERQALETIRDKGSHQAVKYKRAVALLLSDENCEELALSDTKIQGVTGMKLRTIERLRKRCHEVGPLEALNRVTRKTPPRSIKITGEVEAHITRLACSAAPDGRACWTLQLLADKVVALEVIDSISRSSVATVLKKANLNLGGKSVGALRRSKTPPS